jgi:hypothetical protein
MEAQQHKKTILQSLVKSKKKKPVPQSLILFLWLSTIDQFNFGLQKEYIT